jgi:hypothetical protein
MGGLKISIEIIIRTTDDEGGQANTTWKGNGPQDAVRALRSADEALTRHLNFNRDEEYRRAQELPPKPDNLSPDG